MSVLTKTGGDGGSGLNLGGGLRGGVLLSPDALKQKEAMEKIKKLEEEQEKRFNDVSQKLIEVLIQENVVLSEYSQIVKYITNQVNSKMNDFTIDKILK